MKLLLSWLLFTSLCALSSWSSPVVIQSPDVSVTEGENITVTCCWSVEAVRLGVKWMKNQIPVKHVLQSSGTSQNCTELTFVNITHNDSGNYICKVTVELELYAEFQGNGTIITVKDRRKAEEEKETAVGGFHRRELIIYVTKSVPIIALFVIFCFHKSATKPRRMQQVQQGFQKPHHDDHISRVRLIKADEEPHESSTRTPDVKENDSHEVTRHI